MKLWYDCDDLPKELSNLVKLCRFYTPSAELHSCILNVGKLTLLEKLKIFRVNKEREGFELKQLEHLTELRELGIYNLENINTKEEAAKANLIEKNYLERLTLDWDSERSDIDPHVEADVLESLKPYRYLQGLCIRGHGGPSCPTWLGDKLAVEALESLHLDGISWQCLPSLGKMWGLGKVILMHIAAMTDFVIEQSFCMLIRLELVSMDNFEKWVPSHDAQMFPLLQVFIIKDCPKLLELPLSNHTIYPKPDQGWNIDWFPKLQELEIQSCPEFLLASFIPWSETLRRVDIRGVELLVTFKYNSESPSVYINGDDDLQSLDQVLAFSNLAGLEELTLVESPPLEWKHLLMLTSLKSLLVHNSHGLVGPLGGEGDVEWQLPVEYLNLQYSCGALGKELTQLLTHLPRLSKLEIWDCENITRLAVGVGVTSAAAASQVQKEEDGLMLFPAHLSDSLRDLVIVCHELVLVEPSTFRPALQSLQKLYIKGSPKFLSAISSFSYCIFPSSLQELCLQGLEGMGTMEPLSNLTSLTKLDLWVCARNLTCEGMGPLLSTGGQLRELHVDGACGFFAGWDLNPRRMLRQDDGGGQEQEIQQLQLVSLPAVSSSKLQELITQDAVGLFVLPICSFLSSSLTNLQLEGTHHNSIERFTEEQEDALHLLVSLQRLEFSYFTKLQHLPAGLHKLTNLRRLGVWSCKAVRSLPKDDLPKSLQELHVRVWCNEELKQQCRGLVGTIPQNIID